MTYTEEDLNDAFEAGFMTVWGRELSSLEIARFTSGERWGDMQAGIREDFEEWLIESGLEQERAA